MSLDRHWGNMQNSTQGSNSVKLSIELGPLDQTGHYPLCHLTVLLENWGKEKLGIGHFLLQPEHIPVGQMKMAIADYDTFLYIHHLPWNIRTKK